MRLVGRIQNNFEKEPTNIRPVIILEFHWNVVILLTYLISKLHTFTIFAKFSTQFCIAPLLLKELSSMSLTIYGLPKNIVCFPFCCCLVSSKQITASSEFFHSNMASHSIFYRARAFEQKKSVNSRF